MPTLTLSRSRRGIETCTLWALALVCAATPGTAQLPDLPVTHEPIRNEQVRWIVGVSGGRGLGGDSGENSSWIVHAARRFGQSVTFGATAGLHYPDVAPDDARARGQVGVRTDVRLNPGRHDVTWSLVGGVGYAAVSSDVGEWNIPAGVGVAIYAMKGAVPGRPGGPMLKFWGVPRYNLRIADLGTETVTQHGAGVSGGMTWGFEEGVGIILGFEWIHLIEKSGPTVTVPKADRVTASLALRWHV